MNNAIQLEGMGFSAPSVTANGVILNFDSHQIRESQSAYYNGFSNEIRELIHNLKDNPKNVVAVIKITDDGFKALKCWQNGLKQEPVVKRKISDGKSLLQQEVNSHGKSNPDKLAEIQRGIKEAQDELAEVFSYASKTVQLIIDDINALHFKK